MIKNLEVLGPLMRNLFSEFSQLYYILLPLFFVLAVVHAWFANPQGGPEFLGILKRAIIATILLVAFPEITEAILMLANGIADKIDKYAGLDAFMLMAEKKSRSYSMSVTSVLLQFNDLLIATLSFLSYIVLYFARSITFAMYYFFWVFYSIVAPMALLLMLFPSTTRIAGNLFKGMIEVACWKIVWSILGAMLTALAFGDAYQIEGGYVTLMVMNFVIAVAMLGTPMIVSSLVGSGLNSAAPYLGAAAVTAMASVPAKAVQLTQATRQGLNAVRARAQGNQFRNFTRTSSSHSRRKGNQ